MKVSVPSSGKASRRKALDFVGDGDGLSAYFAEINKSKGMSLAEEQKLAEGIKRGDKASLNSLVQANLKFVVAVCRNYRNRGLPMADLISEGNLGLIRAAQKFDGSLNFKFISYGVWWVRQAILLALAEQSRVLSIPAGRVGIIQKIGKANRRLEQNLGRKPMLGEVASEMGMAEKDVTDSLQLASRTLSITTPAPGESESRAEDFLKDEHTPASDRLAMQYILGVNIKALLGTLEPREQKVLTMCFGIGMPNFYNLAEIANQMGLTRERIRQIKNIAIEKLRRPSRARRLAALRN